MSALRSGELFAGVGGLGMAVDEVFGAEPAWFCEFDAAPSKVLAHHFPDVPNFGDVRSVDWSAIECVNVLAGGFPCQDVSLAGRRRGMKDGTRSGLWSEYAKAIDEIRPDWVVIENVRGLLSANAAGDVEPCPWCLGDDGEQHALRALGAVLGDLAELGFDAEWIGLRAADVGAPHGRFRVFILAWPRERTAANASGGRQHRRANLFGDGRRAIVGSEAIGDFGDGVTSPSNEHLTLLPTPAVVQNDGESVESWTARRARVKATGINGNGMGMPLPIAVQLLPTPVAQPSGNSPEEHLRKKPGREVVTDLAILAENGLIESGGRLLPTPMVGSSNPAAHGQISGDFRAAMDRVISEVTLLPTPTVAYATGGNAQRGGDRADEKLPPGIARDHATDWGPYAGAIARWEAIIDRQVSPPVRFDGKGGKARLNPELTEDMMGWPAGWVTDPEIGLTRSEQLKACGNGVVPQQAAAALRELLSRPGVPTVEAVAA